MPNNNSGKSGIGLQNASKETRERVARAGGKAHGRSAQGSHARGAAGRTAAAKRGGENSHSGGNNSYSDDNM